MSRNTTTRILIPLIVAAILLLLQQGCDVFRNTTDDKPAPDQLRDKLTVVQLKLSKVYPNLELKNWTFEGKIESSDERGQTVDALILPENMWFLKGNIADPKSVRVFSVENIESEVDSEEMSNWEHMIKERVETGHYLFELDWTSDRAGDFSTKAIASKDSITYGSLLSNIIIPVVDSEIKDISKRSSSTNTIIDQTFVDITGNSVGFVELAVTANGSEGELDFCTHSCAAENSTVDGDISTLKCGVKRVTVDSGDICRLDFNVDLFFNFTFATVLRYARDGSGAVAPPEHDQGGGS